MAAIATAKDNEAKNKLKEILVSVHNTKLTESLLLDMIEQFQLEHSRVPTTSDFKISAMLPTVTIVKQHMKMTAGEFLDKHYPNRKKCNCDTYHTKTPNEWLEIFIETYHNIKPTSATTYDLKRPQEIPRWQALCKILELNSWNELLNLAGITERYKIRARIKKD